MSSPATQTFGRTPVSGAIGLEISGINLSDPLEDATFDALHEAFLDSCGVLVFRDQFLAPAAQHEFAAHWGTPVVTPHLIAHAYPGHPDVLRVTNVGKKRAVTENWHCDSIFRPDPPPITILAAQELPAAGGDTMWANQYLACERLSPGLRRLLEGLRGKFAGSWPSPETGESQPVFALHPMLRTHPETGRVALLAGHPGDSLVAFEEMTEGESRPLLDYLYEHAHKPDLVYRHHWRPGDVVMWDNRCTMHYAVHDYGEAIRTLSRITVAV